MILLTQAKKKYIYFANRPQLKFGYYVYIQSFSLSNHLFFKREPYFTKTISLTEEIVIMNKFSRTAKYHIRRASKEGVKFYIEKNVNSFVNFYNLVSNNIGLKNISKHDLEKYGDNLVITKAVINNKILSMHSYLIDNEIKRVRLIHTVSLHKNVEDKKERALIGRANRFLHYEDMKYFFSKGFKTYDLGGYAYNTNDKHLQNINKFKDSFGGELEENSNYIPIWLYFAGKLKKALKW